MRYRERRDAAEKGVEVLGELVCRTDNKTTDAEFKTALNGIAQVFLGVWHELHRIADALEVK